jgi:hypothetical protein
MVDRAGDRADGLLDVDHDALLEADGRHYALTDDGQTPVTSHLADKSTDLARTDIDSDEHCFAFHSLPS